MRTGFVIQRNAVDLVSVIFVAKSTLSVGAKLIFLIKRLSEILAAQVLWLSSSLRKGTPSHPC